MSEKIEPAMTAEEWKATAGYWNGVEPKMRHEVAAKCLAGQPFGFTREDVAMLRACAKALDDEHGWPGECDAYGNGNDPLNRLADRIEALLPPDL